MKKKKVNPRRQPVTMADLNKAKEEAMLLSVKYAWAIIFTVLRDKEEMEIEQLNRIWQEVSNLSDSVAKGYVSITDLLHTLEKEADIKIK